MQAKPIDQLRRAELCRRIIQGDAQAALDLASLYREAGYATLSAALQNARLNTARNHARAVLGR